MAQISRSLAETNRIAEDFLANLSPSEKGTVVALQGDLGAGKTAFAQAVGQHLGVKENMHSPTFVIMKVYDIDFKRFKKLIHIDVYRLEKDSELLHLGWEELIENPENLIFIEWPENVPVLIPNDAIRISFKHANEDTREINYES